MSNICTQQAAEKEPSTRFQGWNAIRTDHALHKRLCELRMSGASLGDCADQMSISRTLASRIAHTSCASREHEDNISLASRIRPCLCCQVPIISSHAGHRMCAICRHEMLDMRD